MHSRRAVGALRLCYIYCRLYNCGAVVWRFSAAVVWQWCAAVVWRFSAWMARVVLVACTACTAVHAPRCGVSCLSCRVFACEAHCATHTPTHSRRASGDLAVCRALGGAAVTRHPILFCLFISLCPIDPTAQNGGFRFLRCRASGDLAVRMALGEAAVIAQTKSALAEEGKTTGVEKC